LAQAILAQGSSGRVGPRQIRVVVATAAVEAVAMPPCVEDVEALLGEVEGSSGGACGAKCTKSVACLGALALVAAICGLVSRHGGADADAGLARRGLELLEASSRRPNIIWVMADDLGWGELGAFPATPPAGRPRLATPHLDTFAKEGLVFDHAYSGYTVCAPSRTAFFTGRHSGHFKRDGLNGETLTPEQTNIPNLAHVLQGAGYVTGAFGKIAPFTDPLVQGFDAFIGQISQSYCHNMYPQAIDTGRAELNYNLSGNHQAVGRELCMEHPERYNYTIDVFHATAMKWVEDHANAPAPFFLYLGYTIPHAGGWDDAPLEREQGNPVPTDFHYGDTSWPAVEKDHAAVVTYMDHKVGDLLRRLKNLHIDQNTVVFFASDNGASNEGGNAEDGNHRSHFFNSTGGLRGYKRSLYEGGVRSPSIVRWPGTIVPGRSSFQWAFWDALPTLAQIAGAATPPGLDGRSILPTLRGEQQSPPDFIFFTWPGYVNSTVPSGYSVRKGKWKLVVRKCGPTLKPSDEDFSNVELYDLDADPFETTDIHSSNAALIRDILQLVFSDGSLSCECFQCSWRGCGEC